MIRIFTFTFQGSDHRVSQRDVDLAGLVDGRQEPDQGLALVPGHQAEAEHAPPRQRPERWRWWGPRSSGLRRRRNESQTSTRHSTTCSKSARKETLNAKPCRNQSNVRSVREVKLLFVLTKSNFKFPFVII